MPLYTSFTQFAECIEQIANKMGLKKIISQSRWPVISRTATTTMPGIITMRKPASFNICESTI
jgi:hypothetical protein